ncbi:putative wall-associated receptor kinase-like 16 [Amaranthus tricolor]|uniref:putative wall-associated receptor kinase-like 16 n=1 Tax=Amaranthus tricolor TaxID=29722 RepID=UPI00258F16F9|nr:putative wall-associated receptor kinase-like 16 [Amaranthus tricolor]
MSMVGRFLSFILLCLCLNSTFFIELIICELPANSIVKPGCQTKCGNVTVPYPFGIGLDGKCSLDYFYDIECNNFFYDPPKPFIRSGNLEVLDISIDGQLRISNEWSVKLVANDPIVLSYTANKLTVIGCDNYAYIVGPNFATGCTVGCFNLSDVMNGSCSGIGCCQTSIPKGLKYYEIEVHRLYSGNVSTLNPNGYAFLGEDDKFSFDISYLSSNFNNQTLKKIPIVIDWFIGQGKTCMQAKANMSSYACQSNTNCIDFESGYQGYRCSCLTGYEGNPYLNPGCTDIDECRDASNTNCSHICTNTPSSYNCSCPKGYHGDGQKHGTGCVRNTSKLATMLSLGLSLGFLLLLVMSCICFSTIRRNKQIKMKKKFFEQNGGLLLKQHLIRYGRSTESSKIFSENELKASTKNYRDDRILGRGGYGTVYKGILPDGREVAIKKSKVIDHIQVEQFINEVDILTQINHRNVVKLLGCCLETEVPLLVYEFISNGTPYEHIHKNKGMTSWLTWANCIRLATETADALMYLHSSALIPIIHRDIKSANILLNESNTAKVSDFGASRLVPIDQIHVTTLVQGTLGYLDPEYFRTSQLTEKSDVYSFGVVLAELLTREKPLSSERKIEERNLATYFLMALKEDRLMEILDLQLVREASEEQLVKMAKLIKECLNIRGEDRPTMKEVALELEGFKKKNRHPWSNQNNEDENILICDKDLYSIPSRNTMEYSRSYSMEVSLKSDMNHPR